VSEVDNETTQSDTPREDPDGKGDKVAPVDSVNAEETGSMKSETLPAQEPVPSADGADAPEQGAQQSDATAATGSSDATAATGAKEAAADQSMADEVGEKTEKAAAKVEAVESTTADRVKEVSRGKGGARAQWFRRYWPFALLGLTTVILIVGLFVAISGDKDPSPPQGDKPPAPPAAVGPMETFTDPEGGFSLRYPKAWRRIPIPPEAAQGSDLRLVLSTGTPDPAAPANPNPTGNDGMWVRVIPPSQVEQKYKDFDVEIRGLTGDKPCGTEGSACLRQEQVTVAGMNGVRFIYTTPDAISGQNSIHVQYFLRRNQQGNLYVLVFQAVPTTDLSGLAPAFDEVVASFQAA
jgi:hypothetical protein